jgi:hypothetical protein
MATFSATEQRFMPTPEHVTFTQEGPALGQPPALGSAGNLIWLDG